MDSVYFWKNGNVYVAVLLRSYPSFESKLNALVRSTVPPKFQNPFHPHVNNGLGMLTLGRRFFWVFSQRIKYQHLTFSVAVRSSLAQILRQVWWWSIAMVTKYDVTSSRWSSQFWVKILFFQLLSTIKVNLVAKILQSAYLCVIFHVNHKILPFLAVLSWFLILGKIQGGGQDGDHCWWRHRPPAAPLPIKYTSSC